MISIDPIHAKIKEAYGDTFTLTNEELNKKLLEDGNYRVSMFDYLSKYDPTITNDINKWIDEHSGGSVAVGGEGLQGKGLDGEFTGRGYIDDAYGVQALQGSEQEKRDNATEIAVEEEEEEEDWNPNPNIDYESLPMMDQEKVKFETWKSKQKQQDTELSEIQQNLQLSQPVPGLVSVIKPPPSPLKDVDVPGAVGMVAIRDAKLEDAVADDSIIPIELFTPKTLEGKEDKSTAGTGASGLADYLNNLSALEDFTIETFKKDQSNVDQGTSRNNVVKVTAPDGEVFEIDSFLEGEVTNAFDNKNRRSPKAAQNDFLKYLKNYITEDDIALIKLSTSSQESEVAALFKDAPTFKSKEQEDIFIKNGGKIEGGIFGLTQKDKRDAKDVYNNLDLSFELTSFGGQLFTTQNGEAQLEEAYNQLVAEAQEMGVKDFNPESLKFKAGSYYKYSTEVENRARQNAETNYLNATKSAKWEDWIEGGEKGVEGTSLTTALVTSIKDLIGSKADKRAARSLAVLEYSQQKLNQTLEVGLNNLEELNEFINNPLIKYDVDPRVTPAYETKDGRLLPVSLYENAMVERNTLEQTRNTFEKSYDLFMDAELKSEKEDENWAMIRRNYNDGHKFVNQLGIATADLLINVGYGSYKLFQTINPTYHMVKNMGFEPSGDFVDGLMNSWNSLKNEQSLNFKEDVAFGEIDSWSSLASYSLQSVAQQAPIILSMIATGGLSGAVGKGMGMTGKSLNTLGRVSSSTMIGLNSFGGKVSGMNYEEFVTGKDLYSDAEVLLKGAIYGIVEGGLAYVSTAKTLGDQVNRVKGFDLSKKAVIEEAEEMGKRAWLKNALTKDILPETAIEMGAEGLTTGLQNLVDGRPFLENMTETLFTAGAWGSGMSGMSSVYAFGLKDFTGNKETGIIREATKKYNEYSRQISNIQSKYNNLPRKKKKKYLNSEQRAADLKKIEQLQNLQQIENTKRIDAENQAEVNIKKKGISDPTVVREYVKSLSNAADIRQEAIDIMNDKEMSDENKNSAIEALENDYKEIMQAKADFTNTDTFGDPWAALTGAAVRALPFSETKKNHRRIKAAAIDAIIKDKPRGYKPTKAEINSAASDIMLDEKIEVNTRRDAKIASELGLNHQVFETNEEAVNYIEVQYDAMIDRFREENIDNQEDSKAKRKSEKELKKMISDKAKAISKINKGNVNGLKMKPIDADIISIENMKKNKRTETGIHEITHDISDNLIKLNPAAFNQMGRQLVNYLQYTGQSSVLRKMQLDNANIFDSEGNIDYDEVVSQFIEEGGASIDLEKMDNTIAILGRTFNAGLKQAGGFQIEFSGETEILQYFVGLSKALKSGSLTAPSIKGLEKSFKNLESQRVKEIIEKRILPSSEYTTEQKEAIVKKFIPNSDIEVKGKVISIVPDEKSIAASEIKLSEKNPTLYENTSKIFESDLTTKEKGFEIGQLWKNEVASRLRKGYRLGNQFLKPSDWDGWSDEVANDVVSDVATGNSGIPGIVKNYQKGKGNVDSIQAYINLLLNKKITGYLPNDLVAGDLSIDSETARQIEDVKAGRFDEDMDNKETPGTRQLESFEDLSIVTPELFDGIRKIVTDKLKRVAITKGFNQDTVNTEIQSSIEKEITKVIKEEMGPISKSALGFATKKYTDFIVTNMDQIIGAMPIDVIKQKAKSKAWSNIFKLTEIGREDIKKVDADGKTTNYRKQIFEVQKPDPNDFKKYFTRGGYTTLIARQKSLIQPIAKELAKTEIFKLKNDPDFLNEISKRTGMTEQEVSTMYIDNVLTNLQDVLDQTAGESRSQDTIKFSETLAGKDIKSKQALIDGMKTDTFRSMVSQNLANIDFLNKDGKTSAIRDAMENYFYPAELFFEDITNKEMKRIATDFSGPLKPTFQSQVKAESKRSNEIELSNIIADSLIDKVINQTDYKAIELALGINSVDYDKKSITSINQGRAMALKLAIKIGREKFIRLFAPGLQGPDGLAGLEVTGTPKSLKLVDSDVSGDAKVARTGLFRNVEDLYNNVINAKDANGKLLVGPSKGDFGNVSSKGNMDSRVFKKNWYFSEKWESLNGDKKAELEFINEIAKEGELNKKIYKETINDLAQNLNKLNKLQKDLDAKKITQEEFENKTKDLITLTPTEARWMVSVDSGSMQGALKSSASLIGYPTLNRTDLQQSLNLAPNDKYVLEHMTPAKYMALLTYKYLLDPSAKSKSDFNTELDNFHTIILPDGVDSILRAEGKQASMGMKHRIGDDPFQTRYDEVLAIMELTKKDGSVVGNNTVNYSETFNDKGTQNFDSSLINSSEVKFSESDQNSGISVIEAELLDKALAIARDPNAPVKKIRVFDFDDTLARTNSNVLYTMPDGTKGKLTAEQFAKDGDAMLAEGAVWDFSEFNKVVDGKPGPLLDIAKKIQEVRGTKDVFVLTARSQESAQSIKMFLDEVGLDIPLENITGLGDSSPLAKSGWMVDKAAEGYNDFYFTDDHLGNIDAVDKVMSVIDVKSKTQQAKIKFSETVDQKMNDIIYEKTGIESFKEYSDVKAKAAGRNVKRFSLIPASAEDFGGLLYSFLGKGSEGNAQWQWMQDTLIKPYNRGVNDATIAQNTLTADFKALKNSLEGIPKNLKKVAFDGFTFEDIVRVTAWESQGIEVDGLSKRDLKNMRDFVAENPELGTFAQQIVALTKSDGYYYPGKDWLAGTITTDFREGLRSNTRSRYLKEWNENIDQAFSNKNLNKIEAAYGASFREALENSIYRMKTGTNRSSTMGKLESRVLDYINNSVGTVMFLNTRSAILQTISSINFMNWSDNNPLKAGKAFANQPQFWKDFMFLMNSDYLVDRRNGLKINVSDSEISEAAKTSKNKAKGVISTLLSKGFVLTQFADSFAIASGGATFYRNRLDTYKKQGLSDKEASKKAFEDFKATAETSQQSSDPSKISSQQASTLGKVLLAFANTPSQYSRIMKKSALDLANGRGDWKENISKIVYYGAIQNIIFTTLQSALFGLAFSDDDEEGALEEKSLTAANSMVDNVLRGLGIGGTIVSTVKNLAIDIYDRSNRKRPEYGDAAWKMLDFAPPIDIKVSKFRGGLMEWDYNKDSPEANDPFDINNPAYGAMAKVVAATTNIPLDRLVQKLRNVQGAVDSDNQNWQRIAMLLGWPKWQLEPYTKPTKYKEEEGRSYSYKDLLKSKEDIDVFDKEQNKIKTKAANKLFKDEHPVLYDMDKSAQDKKLKQLGVSPGKIASLKSERERVELIVKLEEDPKYKIKEDESIDKLNFKLKNKKYFKLTKIEQVAKLDSLGLTKKQIRELSSEADRVKKLLELMEE